MQYLYKEILIWYNKIYYFSLDVLIRQRVTFNLVIIYGTTSQKSIFISSHVVSFWNFVFTITEIYWKDAYWFDRKDLNIFTVASLKRKVLFAKLLPTKCWYYCFKCIVIFRASSQRCQNWPFWTPLFHRNSTYSRYFISMKLDL